MENDLESTQHPSGVDLPRPKSRPPLEIPADPRAIEQVIPRGIEELEGMLR
jgi:hypothetical protein